MGRKTSDDEDYGLAGPPQANLFVGRRRDATYLASKDPSFRHNPFVEALDASRSNEDVAGALLQLPTYSNQERKLPPHARLLAVERMSSLVQPISWFFSLYQAFERTLRAGYFSRNPLTKAYRRQMGKAIENANTIEEILGEFPPIRSSASGFAIVGTSGVGKTTGIESVLKFQPQVIHHRGLYEGEDLHVKQVVWLKLECPHDGSIRALVINFFQALDQVIGTAYRDRYCHSRRSVDEMIPDMAHVALRHGLGVLIIDEIQRIRAEKSGGNHAMLDFFTRLLNTIGAPVILIGTYRAMALLTGHFSQARRSVGQGDFVWSNLAPGSDWDIFLETLWRYQWTSKATPLDKKLRDAIYEETQGIADIAVKLYKLMQCEVIGMEDEKLTDVLVHHVAKRDLKLVRPMLTALRHNDVAALKSIPDLVMPDDIIRKAVADAAGNLSLGGTIDTLRNQQLQALKNAEKTDPVASVTNSLIMAGVSETIAKASAERAVDRHAKDTNLLNATSTALAFAKEAMTENSVRPAAKRGEKGKTSSGSTSPRSANVQAMAKKKTGKSVKDADEIYTALEEEGLTRNTSELFS